ncbi:hypothetical protein [Halorubrum yunnanense]|uniref:Uncharacterized protein n=1 Tax=Halorubrum yunnanense TaxID=1526162 RepID=A0ABD5YA46_9EURY|nr:hypothetical protein [Halorubrum yunnanense]
MRDKLKQSLALLGALVMMVSMVAAGFTGTAAADAQDIGSNGIEAGDLIAGTDSVNQTVTFDQLENDGNSETIRITTEGTDGGALDTTGAISEARLADEGSHDVDTVSYDGSTDEITIELNGSTGTVSDLAIEVEWDLSTFTNQDVQYNAAFTDGELGDVDTEFSISEAQPSFGDTDTSVQDAGGATGSQITVDFGDNVDLADGADNSDLADAFTVSGAEDAAGNQLFVDSADIDGPTDSELVLELDGYMPCFTA